MSVEADAGQRSVLIIGAGAIGLASAREALRRGWRVTVLDPDFDSRQASRFNAGGIGVTEIMPLAVSPFSLRAIRWLLDPLGPLAVRWSHLPRMLPWMRALSKMQDPEHRLATARHLASLMHSVYDDLLPLLAELDLQDQLHRDGALTVFETESGYRSEQAEWALRRELGAAWRDVTAQELATLEPGLGRVFTRAILQEDWGHVDDPKVIIDRLQARVREQGAQLVPARIVRVHVAGDGRPTAHAPDGQSWSADRVVVAAGAWSDRLARSLGDRVLLEAERGYTVTLPHAPQRLNREVIFAERKFVATPMSVGLRIGGTAEFAPPDAPANPKRHEALLRLARRFFPGVDERDDLRWMGARPTTPDSLPVIGPSPRHRNVLYAFGHGHVGLTLCATTARYIGGLLDDEPDALQSVQAYLPQRFGRRS